MNVMVERVASAIYDQRHGLSFDLASEPEKKATREIARAAIEAILEPTASMIAAADELPVSYDDGHDVAQVWRTMAREALDERAKSPH